MHATRHSIIGRKCILDDLLRAVFFVQSLLMRESGLSLPLTWEIYSLHVFYPNIHAILLLLLCLPVGSCSYEQSLSALKRLKTWCRSAMADERLDSLAVGWGNHERTLPPKEVSSMEPLRTIAELL